MTKQKTFKRRVRERMAKTGESYASAREALIGAEPAGIHPETSALRFALADAGIEISEALTLIICGGAGAASRCPSSTSRRNSAICTCRGGTRSRASIRDGVERLRLPADVHETGGAKTAERVLRERLAAGAVQIAWVDEGTLRGAAAETGGGLPRGRRAGRRGRPGHASTTARRRPSRPSGWPRPARASARTATACWPSRAASPTSSTPSAPASSAARADRSTRPRRACRSRASPAGPTPGRSRSRRARTATARCAT